MGSAKWFSTPQRLQGVAGGPTQLPEGACAGPRPRGCALAGGAADRAFEPARDLDPVAGDGQGTIAGLAGRLDLPLQGLVEVAHARAAIDGGRRSGLDGDGSQEQEGQHGDCRELQELLHLLTSLLDSIL